METLLKVPQGNFELQRLPQRKNEQLRAWDAADEYLLQYLNDNYDFSDNTKILILNDSFGALAVSLNKFKAVAISDSWLSQQATRHNMVANHLADESVLLRNSLDWPQPYHHIDLVLIKAPKTLAFLEDQLIRLQPLLSANTTIIAAGMVKTMPSKVWKLMEQYLGVTKPSMTRKKARLIFVSLNIKQHMPEHPYPVYYRLENTDYLICNHPNVFSRDSLDNGTRFLLKHLPTNTDAQGIVDLGCGNGVVGLLLAQSYVSAHLSFVDESYMAVASAKETFYGAFPKRSAEFLVADGLTDFETESVDLIVCNPPFHQQNTVGNQIALSFFKQAHRVLRKKGEFRVIGNRHLGYHVYLKSIFGGCSEIASNNKFVIWKLIK